MTNNNLTFTPDISKPDPVELVTLAAFLHETQTILAGLRIIKRMIAELEEDVHTTISNASSTLDVLERTKE